MPRKPNEEARAKVRRVLEQHPDGISTRGICQKTNLTKSFVTDTVRRVGGVPKRIDGVNVWLLGVVPQKDGPYYEPTPEEITQQCLEIQDSEWDEAERRKRAGLRPEDQWDVPVVKHPDTGETL